MKKSEKRELLQYVGDLSALLGMKEYALTDGRAKGVGAIDIKNGKGFEMTILKDRCLDIPTFTYKGINLGFVSKTGVSAPEFYAEDGVRGFLKNFNAGFLTTCGIAYAGAPCEEKGRKMGLHGTIANTPAENVNKEMIFEHDDAVFRITGSMRETCVFEENLYLHREIKVETERNVLFVNDEVENCGFDTQSLMLLYHFNFGYPMLDDKAKVYFSADHFTPRDDIAKKGIDVYDTMEKPQIGYDEQCFFHTCDEGTTDSFALLHNPKLNLAVAIHYNALQCPILCEWKCMRAGDYALGLEPTTAGVMGKVQARKEGVLKFIQPGEIVHYNFAIKILEDQNEIEAYIAKSKEGKK